MGLRIGQICEGNAIDELHLEEAHYAAQSGAHWFVEAIVERVIHGTFSKS